MSGIYDWIANKFPYYGNHNNSKGWQNSIRHNLSLNKAFIRQKERDDGGRKGGTWSINSSINTVSVKPLKSYNYSNSFRKQELDSTQHSLHNCASNVEQLDFESLTRAEIKTIICDNGQIIQSDNETNDTILRDIDKIATTYENITPNTQYEVQILSGLDEFRRKSVEDYLEMSNSVVDPIPQNIKTQKAISRQNRARQITLKNKKKLISGCEIKEEITVPVPPPPKRFSNYIPSNGHLKETANESSFLDLGEYQNKLYYEGSIDYWQQYDPELVQKSGFAIITTDEANDSDTIHALCYLCGSEGKFQSTIETSRVYPLKSL